MSFNVAVGLVLVMIIVIISIVYLGIQANKRHKTEQLAAKSAEKAKAAANRAAWEKWRKR
jgi:hypothetical protein